MRRILLGMIAALFLAGCERGSEDFAVAIARSPEPVAAALGKIEIDPKIGQLIPNLRFTTSTPAPGQILYTIPGNRDFEATVLLKFEPAKGGKATVVRVAVDIPLVKVEAGGGTKFLNESRIERALKRIIQDAGKRLEQGKAPDNAKAEFSQVLTVLAIASDSKKLQLFEDLQSDPERMLEAIVGLEGSGLANSDYPDQAYGDLTVSEDPAAALRREEYLEERQARDAAKPMDEAYGDSTHGDNSGGSDY